MSLITHPRYVTITGDTSSAPSAVAEWLDDATARLEEDLGGRPLAEAERTELMWPDRMGMLYPAAMPVLAASVGRVVGGVMIAGAAGRHGEPVDVTYTGGFVERTANPAATNRLPVTIERDLAHAAYALGHRDELLVDLPRGITAARVGDISLNFGTGVQGSTDDLRIGWSSTTARYRRRSL